MFALAIIITSITLTYCLPSAMAEEDETMGWLEGTVKDEDGTLLPVFCAFRGEQAFFNPEASSGI